MQPWNEDVLAEEAAAEVSRRILAPDRGGAIEDVLGATLYHERLRLTHASEADRDAVDRSFYGHVAADLLRADDATRARLVHDVVDHYAREVQGHFDWRVYELATRALPVLLTALLHGVAPSRMLSRMPRLGNVDDHVMLGGEVERLCALARRGTVILVPTHVSNLDSLVVGYSIFRMGLPPFRYGAGLNLFSNPVEGFFMRHLGAYTVDRRKTDPTYRAVVKEYATASLEHGQHNLFFPGGTRSRSGAIETAVKKGLLGTPIVAFRRALAAGRQHARFYVVPCTLTYPLVLEAASLVDDHLREDGKARHILVDDEYGKAKRWLDFMSGLMELDVHIHVTIGAALDPIGNDVDEHGESRDHRGRAVDPRRYLLVDGEVAQDDARDAAYTRHLAARVVEAFHRDHVVLPSSAVSFAVFEVLRSRARHHDVHRLLREASTWPTPLPTSEVLAAIDRVTGALRALAARGAIRLGAEVRESNAPSLLESALRTLSIYHRPHPVLARREGAIAIGDPQLLFYYRNRLDGYGLSGAGAAP